VFADFRRRLDSFGAEWTRFCFVGHDGLLVHYTKKISRCARYFRAKLFISEVSGRRGEGRAQAGVGGTVQKNSEIAASGRRGMFYGAAISVLSWAIWLQLI
jgi:hypothetical protein